MRALKDEMHPEINRYRKLLEKENYFILEDKFYELLKPHFKVLNTTLHKGTRFIRARNNYKYKANPIHGNMGGEWHYKPFTNNEISAPPPLITDQGRMNRAGVSFMYLATDRDTAISEIKPHPGQFISVGEFTNEKKLKVADFNSISIADFSMTDNSLENFVLLNSINKLFSIPIPRSNQIKYSFTQFLADLIRKHGFDGIAYKSSVGDGINYVFFDAKSFQYVENSGSVFEIKSLKYKYMEQELMADNNYYHTKTDGTFLS